jgi:hypothetical protein
LRRSRSRKSAATSARRRSTAAAAAWEPLSRQRPRCLRIRTPGRRSGPSRP